MKRIFPLLRLGLVFGLALFSLFLTTSCLKIDSVNQPINAQSGEVITITVATYHTSAFGGFLIRPYFGVHLPDNWTVTPPLNYNGGYTGSIIYDPDLSNLMESISAEPAQQWWVGMGDGHDSTITDNWAATGTIHLQTGNRAGIYYLDYMTGDSNDGINYDLRENNPITITGDYGAGWMLTPDIQIASNTTTISIPLTLIDLGETARDSFDLSIEPPPDWSGDFFTTVPVTRTDLMTLYQSLSLTVQLNLPANPLLGLHFIPITATSVTDPNATTLAFLKIAVLSDQRGYALTGNSILLIDPIIYQPIKTLDISAYSPDPAVLALSPDRQRLFVANNHTVLIIDTVMDTPVTSIPFLGWPSDIAFTCDSKFALVATNSPSELYFIDTSTSRVRVVLSMPSLPSKVATSCPNHLALVTSQNDDTVTVVDTNKFSILKTITGFQEPADVVIAANGQRAYITNVDNDSIGVINVGNQTLLETWDGDYDAGRLALSPDGQRLYTSEESHLLVIDTATGRVAAQINLMPLINNIVDIEVSADGKWVFAIQNGYSSSRSVLNVISTFNHNIVYQINLEGSLHHLALYSSTCLCEKTYLPVVIRKK